MDRGILSRLASLNSFVAGGALLGLYMLAVQCLRFQRCRAIQAGFAKRPLSSMTVGEAHQIVSELRMLEFPYSFHTAMKVSLLKTAAIPTMSKLFLATGQLNEKNASKRAADTEVILNEVYDRDAGSEPQLLAIARMNHLHARYRKAGKILDEDMLHTIGSGVVEIVRNVNNNEWRQLTEVEMCAIGVFHKALGDAMDISFTFLPSGESGWTDGSNFVQELCDWTTAYEKKVAKVTEPNRIIARQIIDTALLNLPATLKPIVKNILSSKLDRHIRVSMGLQEPGMTITSAMKAITIIRKYFLRYFSLPRPRSRAVTILHENPNPATGLYNINLWIAHPWYVKPDFRNRWGLKAAFVRLFGNGAIPTWSGPYKENGYDLGTIGPTAQEHRGKEQTMAFLAALESSSFANGCPFHT